MSGQKWRTCRLTASCARSSFTHKLQHPPCRGRPEPRRERSGLRIEHLPGRLCFVEHVFADPDQPAVSDLDLVERRNMVPSRRGAPSGPSGARRHPRRHIGPPHGERRVGAGAWLTPPGREPSEGHSGGRVAYSSRSVTIGLTLAARRAGTTLATTAVVRRTVGTATKVVRSNGLTS